MAWSLNFLHQRAPLAFRANQPPWRVALCRIHQSRAHLKPEGLVIQTVFFFYYFFAFRLNLTWALGKQINFYQENADRKKNMLVPVPDVSGFLWWCPAAEVGLCSSLFPDMSGLVYEKLKAFFLTGLLREFVLCFSLSTSCCSIHFLTCDTLPFIEVNVSSWAGKEGMFKHFESWI